MEKEPQSRRDFIKTTGLVGLATLAAAPRSAHAAGSSDKIRIGLIGAGDRGTVSAGMIDCAEADQNIELVAMGDVFADHMEQAPANMQAAMEKRGLPFKDIFKVSKERMFVGFDAYKKVIECDVDLIILTTPPVFRPIHFKAAVEAGKHVFVEKPIAVDAVGARDFIKTTELAKKKGLTVVAGTQMRRAAHINAAVEKMREGAIGALVGGQSARIGGAMLDFRSTEAIRQPGWSDMEWQLRRWLFTVWASGDFIVEQHVHNLDLIDWLMGSRAIKATGLGGRQSRTDSMYPNVWDHMTIEYEYENGARVSHLGSQIDGMSYRNDIRLNGENGQLYLNFGKAAIEGKNPWSYTGERINPSVKEYKDTLDSIRNSAPLNEGEQIAQSTLTAILGRMAAYTGRSVSRKWLLGASELDLTPKEWKFGELPLAAPAIPGRTKLI